jgi:nitroimidazol reductase NimA-like FMN-containing flavoprotein (pyridoxamine 5'-phosphate oxidase superfamily)
MTGTTRQAAQMAESALTAHEALRLLGQVRFGRVVFTSRAMPAVRPVRHVVADGQIIIAAGPELVLGSSYATTTPPSGTETIVAFEADQFDVTGCQGWSVVVVGRTSPVTDDAEARLYRQLLPAMAVPDQLVAIRADVVSGFLVSDATRPDATDR